VRQTREEREDNLTTQYLLTAAAPCIGELECQHMSTLRHRVASRVSIDVTLLPRITWKCDMKWTGMTGS
jgi:hypothetical protein